MAGSGAGTINRSSRPVGTPASTSCSRSSPSQQQSSKRRSRHSNSSTSSRWSFLKLPRNLLGGFSRQQLLLAVLSLVALQAAVAVNIVYDETGWTKRDWHKYKIDFDINTGVDPADEVLKSADLRKHLGETHLNSLHGPVKRKAVSKYAGLWARDDGSLVTSLSEDAIEQASEAVMCTTCHSLVSHVWGQLVSAINHADPVSESTVKELIEDACETQVPYKVLSKYRIVQVEAPELDMSLFVVRERKGTSSSSSSSDTAQQLPGSSSKDGTADAKGNADSAGTAAAADGTKPGKDTASSSSSSTGTGGAKPADEDDSEVVVPEKFSWPVGVTPAELEAVQKACTDLALHHMSSLQKQVWPKAKEFFNERTTLAQKILTKAQWYNDDAFWEPDAYEDPDEPGPAPDTSLSMDTIKHKSARKLVPADQLCLDMDIMCPYWATQGQCSANPAYMVGDKKHIGHCKASCKACTPKNLWKKHPQVKAELKKAAAAAGQLLRTQACSASRACMAGGSSSSIGTAAATKDTGSLLPGAVLAKTPGFVLGKPFWGVPTVKEDPTGGLTVKQRVTDPAQQDIADEVLVSEGLGNKLLSIPGMDHYFVYQLEYKRRVYQYASKAEDGKVKEEHVLGTFDPKATAAAAKHDKVAAAVNLEASRAWQAQWKLQAAAHKHSGGTGGTKDADSPPVAPPMLELLDYLPDTESMVASYWPYMRQMYTGGETCMVEGKSVERQVELRAACSPDSATHLLVREPNFCRYIMVLYHPQLCDVQKLKPVPVLSSSSSGGGSGGQVTTGLPGAAAGSKAAAAGAVGGGRGARAQAAKPGSLIIDRGVKKAAAAAVEGAAASKPATTGAAGGTGAGKGTEVGSGSSHKPSSSSRSEEEEGSKGKPKLSTS